jgi:hypothetical protein
MFRKSVAGRTTRALATGALILSLGATTFVGSANAAPLANNEACSAAANVRSDAVHALHDAWKASVGELKALVPDMEKQAMKKELENELKQEIWHELLSAWHDLKSVAMQAKEDIWDIGLGAACHHDDDDKNVTPAQGAATTAADTSALEAKFKAIVDTAIKDMQAVVEAARKSVAEMTAAATTTNGTDVAKNEDSKAEEDEDKDDDDKDDGDKHNSHEMAKVKSINHAKATDLAAKLKSKHTGRRQERERD